MKRKQLYTPFKTVFLTGVQHTCPLRYMIEFNNYVCVYQWANKLREKLSGIYGCFQNRGISPNHNSVNNEINYLELP